MSWRDISTAPKDGTPVILAYRLAEDETDWFVSEGFFDDDLDRWWAANTSIRPATFDIEWPELWQPLPEPPEPGQ